MEKFDGIMRDMGIRSTDDENIVDISLPRLPYLEGWLNNGGVSADGTRYARPSSAIAWGEPGCPILPKFVRETLGTIRLNSETSTILGADLTIADLDAGVLNRLGNDGLTYAERNTFSQFIYKVDFHLLGDATAIPAGAPQYWIDALPLTARTKGAARRAFNKFGTGDFLVAPMTVREFLSISQVGPIALIELACVIESAETTHSVDERYDGDSHPKTITMPVADFEEIANREALRLLQNATPSIVALQRLAKWAQSESDATTVGDAFANAVDRAKSPVEWGDLSLINLSDIADCPPHPYQIIADWITRQSPREQAVFHARLANRLEKTTLEVLGQEFGVSRERIRQVEKRLSRKLDKFLQSEIAQPIRWRIDTLRHCIGAATPEHSIENFLIAPAGCADYRLLLIDRADCEVVDDWIVSRGRRQSDPVANLSAVADEVGRIDMALIHKALNEWGLQEEFHLAWLRRGNSVREFNGTFVLWGRTVAGRMAFALADIGHPAKIDDMMAYIGEERPRPSVINALSSDDRLVKASRTHWALASWDLPEYNGVAYSIKDIISECGGAGRMDAIVTRMQRGFGISETTTRAYFSAPMFVSEGHAIRLRTDEDEPFTFDKASVPRARGVFRLANKRVGLLIEVIHDTLRGSGTPLSHGAGYILQVNVNDRLEFHSAFGEDVSVTLPESTTTGPTLGSVRAIVERLHASPGQLMALTLDGIEMSLDVRLVDPDDIRPGWDAIEHLTGLKNVSSIECLADAMMCDPGETRKTLEARRDFLVLKALPSAKSAISLDDALAALASQIRND